MTFLDSFHEIHSATICGLYITSHSPLKEPMALKNKISYKCRCEFYAQIGFGGQPKVGHLFNRMLFWFPEDRQSRRMTQISYADPAMERWLSHRAGGDTLQCISIPLNPSANVAGPQGTFLVREHRQWSKCQFKSSWIVGIGLLSMHELETFKNVCV